MMPISNNTGISLALAVWLVHDEYDYSKIPNYISATSLMKPLRQIVLRARLKPEEREQEDVIDYIPRALGHSIHDSVEKAWTKGYKTNLRKLGTPEHVIERVLVNPTDEEVAAAKDPILVYVEQRAMKTIKVRGKEWTIGGKFDMVSDGIVQDFKTTSAYTWVYGGRDDEHAMQGSLYRWLNPDKILEDFIRINYLFTDWQKFQAKSNPNYPQQRVEHKDIPLIPIDETEQWVIRKLDQVMQYWDVPEDQIPLCTDEDLWMSDPTHKYFAKIETAQAGGRCTKKFENLADAKAYMAEKGNKGIIITEKGEPKRCDYCESFKQCSQKDTFDKYQQL